MKSIRECAERACGQIWHKAFVLYGGEPCAFDVIGVYSHFATADIPADNVASIQIAEFQEFIARFHPAQKRMLYLFANSGGMCYYPDSHMDMVRPDLLAFGIYPHLRQKPEGIKPILSLKLKSHMLRLSPKAVESVMVIPTLHPMIHILLPYRLVMEMDIADAYPIKARFSFEANATQLSETFVWINAWLI